jgi:hypothetical protein
MEIDFKWFLGVLGLAIGAFSSKLLDRWFSDAKEQQDEVHKLTLAMTELRVEIKHLSEKLHPIPRMQQDLNELHGKVRELRARQKEET